MTNIEIAYLIALIVVIVVALFYIQKLLAQIEMLKQKNGFKKDNSNMLLTAYERLTLYTERTKLEQLVSRWNQPNLSAIELHQLMINSIKEEFEHNATQQIYIASGVWNGITKMKEQNIYILNQVLQTVEKDAPSTQYIKNLVTFLSTSENATMNNMILEALQHEAKQLM
jgi:hypothetical protein